MHIWHHERPNAARLETGAARTTTNAAALAGILLAACAGCANPGPPLPPSLKLPAVVETDGLTATRVGDAVALHWTTPTHTTDKLLIAGPVTAVVCRNSPSDTPSAVHASTKAARPPCTEVKRLAVSPGPSDAVDTLPTPLTLGLPRPLVYRVELLNAVGRTAGPSTAVYAAAGEVPPPIQDFHADSTKPGVLLRWRQQAGSGEAVELERTTLEAPQPAQAAATAARTNGLPSGLTGKAKEPVVVRFAAGNTDVGGTLDRTVQLSRTYTYTAQRVRSAMASNNQMLELRSAPTAAVTVAVRDVFPPEVPAGLVAVPGFAGEGEVRKPAIDLSWDPDVEPRVSGYRVYRREGDSAAWQRLTAELVPSAAYRDAAVVAGHTYTYRVTAVSDAGNESAPSAEVTETAPAQ
jgi:hypothetical protein